MRGHQKLDYLSKFSADDLIITMQILTCWVFHPDVVRKTCEDLAFLFWSDPDKIEAHG